MRSSELNKEDLRDRIVWTIIFSLILAAPVLVTITNDFHWLLLIGLGFFIMLMSFVWLW